MMGKRTLHPLLQRAAALVILGVALGAGVAAIGLPLAEAIAANRTAEQRLAHFDGVLGKAASAESFYDAADLSSVHTDDAEAQTALRSTLDRTARKSGVAVQSVRPLAAEYLSKIGRGVWVEMTFVCDLQALVDFLKDIDTARPVLLVRRLQIQRGDGPRPDSFMRVTMEAGKAWRSGSAEP